MGVGIMVMCKTCLYRDEFMLGMGMLHVQLDNCLQSINKKSRERMQQAITGHTVESHQFSEDLYSCEHCSYLFSRPKLTVTYGDNQQIENQVRCGKCRRKVESNLFLEDLDKTKCPDCRSVGMDYAEHMMWD